MRAITANGRWPIVLPEHRAARAQWETGWEPERLDSMHANIRGGDVLIDVGAEEGDMTALYALWGAEVIPMEPNPRVWPNIRAIFEANGLRNQLAGGFVGFAGDTTKILSGDSPWLHSPYIYPPCAFGPVIGDHGFEQLNERPDRSRVRLDDVVDTYARGVDCITIDCEGSELSVLRGASRILNQYRPLVWVSVHPVFMREQYGVTYDQLLLFMEDAGYKYDLLAIDHEHHYLFYPRICEYVEGVVIR